MGLGSAVRWQWAGFAADDSHFEQWFTARLHEYGVAEVCAAEALWIAVTRHVLEVGSWIRWRHFTSHSKTQNSLRTVCAGVAGIVGAGVMYYLPDSGPGDPAVAGDAMFEGRSFEQVAECLQRFGPPCATIAEAVSGGYYLERLPLTSAAQPGAPPDGRRAGRG